MRNEILVFLGKGIARLKDLEATFPDTSRDTIRGILENLFMEEKIVIFPKTKEDGKGSEIWYKLKK